MQLDSCFFLCSAVKKKNAYSFFKIKMFLQS